MADAAEALDDNVKTFSKFAAGTTLTVESQNYGISSIGFLPMKDYARPKTVTVTVNAPVESGRNGSTTLPAPSVSAVRNSSPAL